MDVKKSNNGHIWQLCCSVLLGLTFWLGPAEQYALADQTSGSEANKVVVAVPRNYPPHYQQMTNGQMQGFAIDVIEQVASRAGLKLSYLIKDDWPSTIQALRDGEADLIPNFGISQPRQSEFLFTAPLETFAVSVFVRQSAIGNSATEGLRGKKVGSVQGNVAVKMLRRHDDLQMQIYTTPTEALFALLSTKIDALVYPQPWIWTAAGEAGIESLITPVGEPLLEVQRAIAVSKHKPALFSLLNNVVDGFRDSPEYWQIYSHWFRPAPPFWTVKLTVIVMGLALGLAIWLLLSWRFRSLRRANLELQQSSQARERALLRLKESQDWNREAERMARLCHWSMDPRSGEMQWSAEARTILHRNLDKRDLSEPMPWTYDEFLQSIPAASRNRVDQQIMQAAEQRTQFNLSHPVLLDNGQIRQLTQVGQIRRDKTGQPALIIATVKDVTDQQEVENALRRSQKMEAVGQIVGGIAHDFNNLLHIILGNLDLLTRQSKLDKKASMRLQSATQAGRRGADLIRQLLTFSRHESIDKQQTIINQLIQEMDSLIIRSVTPAIIVEVHLSEDLWPVYIEPGEFQDSLLNLVINARDAMMEGGRLTIETYNIHLDEEYTRKNPGLEPGDYVQLVINDTGTGIDETVREQVFEPFFTTKPRGKGSGLGLSMVYGFVQRSGGLVKIYSELGIGTTFRIYLPRMVSGGTIKKTKSDDTVRLPKAEATVLVVDDEIELLELATEYLKEQGFKVLTAENAMQALALLREKKVDLLFSDVVMPGGINGYELAEQALRNHPQLRVILTSGFSQRAVVSNGQARFDTTILNKPYTRKQLLETVAQTLGMSNQT